ncbi:MAG: glycosyltransferase [Actinobacteria bacterium]|nr:glycosyltransferase [Actinomycetota bacterium]
MVVIPTFNEVLTVQGTISRILALHPELFVLVVDDNSPDGTGNLIRNLSLEDKRISLLSRQAKQGLGVAYLEGFEWAFKQGFDFIVEVDADGSHRPEDLGLLLEKCSRSDLVIGSRWIPGGKVINWPAARKLISRFGNGYARFMLGTEIADMTSGFRIYRASFLKQLVSTPVSSHGYSFQVELAYRASKKGQVVEVPITFVERVSGQSKMTLAIVLEALTKVTFWGLKRVIS